MRSRYSILLGTLIVALAMLRVSDGQGDRTRDDQVTPPFTAGTTPVQIGEDEVMFTYLGSAFWGGMYDMEFRGQYAFCAMQHGLLIEDMSDESSPVTVARLYTDRGRPYDIDLAGDLAYVASDDRGLRIIDISDPYAPTIVSELELPFRAFGVKVSGDYAYMLLAANGLQIVDVSNPLAPVPGIRLDSLGHTRDLAIDDTLLYLADSDFGLHVIDVSDHEHPLVLSRLVTTDKARAIGFDGHGAVLAEGRSGIWTVDVSDPLQPREIANYWADGEAVDVKVQGDIAYGCLMGAGLHTLDISDPSNPIPTDTVPLLADMLAVSRVRAFFWYPAFYKDVQSLDLTDPAHPTLLATYGHHPDLSDMGVSGTRAWVMSRSLGLHAVDISDPVSPLEIGQYPHGWNAAVEVDSDFVFLAAVDTGRQVVIRIFDHHATGAFIPLSEVRLPSASMVQDFAAGNNYAYLLHEPMFLDVVHADLDTTLHHDTAYTIPLEPRVRALAHSDSMLFLCDDNGFQVHSLANPARPALAGRHDLPGTIRDVAVHGSVAVAMNNYPGALYTVDLESAGGSATLGSISMPGRPIDVCMRGSLVLVGTYYAGVQVVDISNPAEPRLLGLSPAYIGITQVAVADSLIALAGNGGLFMVAMEEIAFTPGDVNDDGEISMADIMYLANYLFKGGPAPGPLIRTADLDCDGRVSLVDVVMLVNYMFRPDYATDLGCL